MKNFLLLVALILSFAFDAGAPPTTFVDTNDTTSSVICKIIGYTHGIGGPMITIVIIAQRCLQYSAECRGQRFLHSVHLLLCFLVHL